ncbi:MAG: 7-cyano-7-deazaguanine synthase [Elusimicrobiota bacterium]
MRPTAATLVSGADSEVLVAELMSRGWNVLPIYVRCGFRWEAEELARLRPALRSLRGPRLKRLTVLHAPMRPLMRGHWSVTGRGVPNAKAAWDSVYLPGRNMVLLTEAWLHAAAQGADAVAIGTLKGNPFPDATPRFRAAAERALNLGFATRIKLLAPYARLTKLQVLQRAGKFRLELAFSCLQPKRGKPCGDCSKCAELMDALTALRLEARSSRRRGR